MKRREQDCLPPIPSQSFPLLARQLSLSLIYVLHLLLSPSAFPLSRIFILWHAGAHPLTYLNRRPLASSGSLPAVITKPSAVPVSLDIIVPSSPVVQSTLHTVVDATLPASTPFPVPANTSPGIDDGPSLTSPQIGQSPPVSFGGDAPANSAFSDVLDVVSPVVLAPTGGQPQGITAAMTGGLVHTSIPNGETIGPVSLTPALSPGEIGISTITVPATTGIATTDFTSILPSVISGYVVSFCFVPPHI